MIETRWMLHLRPYRAEDREACLGIVDSNVPEYFLPSDRAEVASFLDDLERLGVRYFVIEDDAAGVVACGGVAVDEQRDARMCWGMVERSHHKQGLGRLLLLFRILEGASMGAETASLATIGEVAGFFAAQGFDLTGGEDDHYAPGMHRRDFALTLDEATVGRLRERLAELSRSRLASS